MKKITVILILILTLTACGEDDYKSLTFKVDIPQATYDSSADAYLVDAGIYYNLFISYDANYTVDDVKAKMTIRESISNVIGSSDCVGTSNSLAITASGYKVCEVKITLEDWYYDVDRSKTIKIMSANKGSNFINLQVAPLFVESGKSVSLSSAGFGTAAFPAITTSNSSVCSFAGGRIKGESVAVPTSCTIIASKGTVTETRTITVVPQTTAIGISIPSRVSTNSEVIVEAVFPLASPPSGTFNYEWYVDPECGVIDRNSRKVTLYTSMNVKSSCDVSMKATNGTDVYVKTATYSQR